MKAGYQQRIKTAISEAERFIDRAKLAIEAKDDWDKQPQAKRAAMKRASMDLTRALAQVRKGEWV